jgi:S1-C subfamily serine protease
MIHKLKDLSDILKSLNPGDKIPIAFIREEREMTITVEVAKND